MRAAPSAQTCRFPWVPCVRPRLREQGALWGLVQARDRARGACGELSVRVCHYDGRSPALGSKSRLNPLWHFPFKSHALFLFPIIGGGK